MKDGRFCRDGPKAEIVTSEHIGNLFDVPLQVREDGEYYYATGF